jgi:beta-phosphoglucomutase-like phosphatase (HAD superfamily)
MAALGVPAAASLVIEDSLVGVTAGLASGAAVLGVPSLQPLEPLPGLRLVPTLSGVGVADLVRWSTDRPVPLPTGPPVR